MKVPPSEREIVEYAKALGYEVEVIISGKTIDVRTPDSKVSAPHDIGNYFAEHDSYIHYSDYRVIITYD